MRRHTELARPFRPVRIIPDWPSAQPSLAFVGTHAVGRLLLELNRLCNVNGDSHTRVPIHNGPRFPQFRESQVGR
jgi:hypothetical protein